jgi:hypothetical protein
MNELSYLDDGAAWRHFHETWSQFAKDDRNIRLGLATNDFNPFRNMTN